MKDSIRIVSYNIQSGNGMDHVYNVPRTAAAIDRLKPDAVGLQEVRIYADRPGDGDIPAILSAHTGLTAHFGLAISFPTFEYGIGILSKYPSEVVERIELPCVPGTEQRVALVTKIRHPAKEFYLITTHFSFERGFEAVRLNQMKTILEAVRTKHYAPAVLTGDLNAVPSEPCVRELAKEWTIADTAESTFNSAEPFEHIDYIAWHPADAFRLKEYCVVDEPLASDHRPILADLIPC